MQETILLLDNQEATDSVIVDGLREAGFEVSVAFSEEEIISYVHNHLTDLLLIIDSSVLDEDIKAVKHLLERIKQAVKHQPVFPVIMLTDAKHKHAVVEGFEAGAHDVIIKPFECEELLVRIRNLLNIFHLTRERENLPITVGDLTVEPLNHIVMREHTEIALTAKEFELLLYLVKHANQACSREQILKEVWDYSYQLGTNVVDVYIRHLRKKLERGYSRKMIHTVRGVGYILKEGK